MCLALLLLLASFILTYFIGEISFRAYFIVIIYWFGFRIYYDLRRYKTCELVDILILAAGIGGYYLLDETYIGSGLLGAVAPVKLSNIPGSVVLSIVMPFILITFYQDFFRPQWINIDMQIEQCKVDKEIRKIIGCHSFLREKVKGMGYFRTEFDMYSGQLRFVSHPIYPRITMFDIIHEALDNLGYKIIECSLPNTTMDGCEFKVTPHCWFLRRYYNKKRKPKEFIQLRSA